LETFDRKRADAYARELRLLTLECIASIGVGHVGGSLSICDLLGVLYHFEMRIDPANPKWPERDRLVLSKGHAGPALYAALAQRGYFPTGELLTLNTLGTKLPSHCDMNKTPGVDMTAGSLGQGFACSVGIALAARARCWDARTFAIIGDGESQEGQIWEAAMLAASKKLSNLIAFTDWNGMQIDGLTKDVNDLGDLPAKWRAFGWDVAVIDGHDTQAIYDAIQAVKAVEGKPHMIVMKTVKGKGVSFVEAAGAANHSMPITPEQLELARQELSA